MNRRVVQLCPSLGSRCGIATYTQMLCEATGHRPVKTLAEVGQERIEVLHLQHEFGIVPESLLDEVIAFCRRRSVRLFVTMHRVEKTSWWVLPWVYRDGLQRRWTLMRTRRAVPPSESGPSPGSALLRPPPGGGLGVVRQFAARRRAQRTILRASELVVVHSPAARDELARQGGRKLRVMHHPVKLHPTSPTLRSEADGRLHVGFFGFLSPAKDLTTLVEACEAVPDVRLHLLASVPGNASPGPYARSMIDLASRHDWIDLNTGFLPLERVIHDLSLNDVNVYLTTDLSHGFSSSGAIRQYLAAGRPVVANRSVLVSELEDVITVIPDRRVKTIARALREAGVGGAPVLEYARKHAWERVPDLYATG